MVTGLRDKFVSGFAWMGISKFGVQGIQFIVTFILARLLSPVEFGLIGLANIFLLIANQINQLGISAALVQKADIDEDHCSSSFWVNILFGLFLSGVVFALSWPASIFFHSPDLKAVMQVLSILFLLGSFKIVQNALLTKNFEFKKLATIDVLSTIISGITSIVMALTGWGVWSLVAGRIINILISVVLAWMISPWRPHLIFHLEKFKELFHFGFMVMATNIVGFLNGSITLGVIGRLLDVSSVGLYSIASNIVAVPSRRLTMVITQVMFPVLSRLQNEPKRFRDAYFKVLNVIAIITFPLLIGLACVAPEAVRVILGTKWEPIIPILQIFCFMGMVGGLNSTVGSVFCGKGRPDIELKLDILIIFIFVPAVLIAARWQLIGIAWAILLVSILMISIFFYQMRSLMNYRLKDLFNSLGPALKDSLLMGVCILIYKIIFKNYFSNELILLATSILIGAIVYFTFVRCFQKNIYFELKEIFMQRVMACKKNNL